MRLNVDIMQVDYNDRDKVVELANTLGKNGPVQHVYERLGDIPKTHSRYFISFASTEVATRRRNSPIELKIVHTTK